MPGPHLFPFPAFAPFVAKYVSPLIPFGSSLDVCVLGFISNVMS